MAELADCRGFDWDAGNQDKNWLQHGVARAECEQAFLNLPIVVADDVRHSAHEERHYALGVTDLGRRLFIVFTIRGDLVRVISARDMSRRERRIYESAQA